MRKFLKFTGMGLASLFIAIQFIRPPRTNPPVTAPIQVPARIDNILRQTCFDCHSNQTKWPWYSNIAPASWLLADDVKEARQHLNFSTWSDLPEEDKIYLFIEIAQEVEAEAMPPKKYTLLHPKARLSPEDRKALLEWADGQ